MTATSEELFAAKQEAAKEAPAAGRTYTSRECLPPPMGIVMEQAFATPAMDRAATECPMERPRPKLVKVVPTGVMASKSARRTESVPGSHPAAVMLVRPDALAA